MTVSQREKGSWYEVPWILLVDDNEINRLVAARLLQKAGYRFDIAVDGEQAVLAASRSRFDAILMDIQLPILDGIAAAEQIRRGRLCSWDTPIIGLTSNEYFREPCFLAGMNDFLLKPIRFETLRDTLRRWIPSESSLGVLVPDPCLQP